MIVSVIIPCYNVEKYIAECIESVVAQTYKNIEIICVDNNSTDNTWDTLCQLKKKYPIILEKEFKAGASAARNKGLLIAKGNWIQFLDADDLLLPTKIEHQLSLVQGKNIGFIAGAWKVRTLNGNEKNIIQFNQNVFIAVFRSSSGNTCSNLWNKNVLLAINGWNESLKSSQEADLMMRIALNGNVFFIDKIPLTIIRERESGQISQGNPKERWIHYIDVRLEYLKELKNSHFKIFYKNKKVFYNFLLISLITLSEYDRHEAIKIFDNHVKKNINMIDLKSVFIKSLGFNIYLKLKFALKNSKFISCNT